MASPARWTELRSGASSRSGDAQEMLRHKQGSPELHQYPEGEPKFQKTAELRDTKLDFLCGFLCSERRIWLNKSIEEAVLHEENKNYAELVRCKPLLKSLHTMIEPYFLFSWIACKSCCLCGSHVPSSPVQTCPLATCFCSWATPPGCAKEATALQHIRCCAYGGTFIHLWA